MDPALTVYQGGKTMYQQLNESRLCVGTYNSTTDLETLSRNYPTVTFFNPKYFELRESAKPYFKKLCQVGIYHESPISAALKVNEVYRDPTSWWNSSDIQEVREQFCRQFAWTKKNWIPEWKNRFKLLMKKY